MIKKMEFRAVLITLSYVLSMNSLAGASDLPLVSLPSVTDYTSGNGWSAGVGFSTEYSTVFRGSDHYEISIKPEGAVQWRNDNNILFLEGFDLDSTELGWRGLVRDRWLLEAGIAHEIVIPSSHSEAAGIDQLPHRGSHILGFVEAKYSIDNGWGNWVSARLMSGSNTYGWQAKIEAGHSFSDSLDNNGIEMTVFSTFGSDTNLNNYFGITEFDSMDSDLKETSFEGGYRSSGLGFVYRENFSERLQIAATASVEFYSKAIKKSELVNGKPETSVDLSIIWSF